MSQTTVEDSGTGQVSEPMDTPGEYAQDNIVVAWELLLKGNL